MSDSKALRIVAILFLLTAIESVVEFFCAFSQHRILIPYGILGFFIYAGLPAYRRPWRTVALVLVWITQIFMPLLGLVAIFSGGILFIDFLGYHIARVAPPVYLLWLAFWWSVNFWQYRVLMRPSIRVAFLNSAAAG